MTDSFERGRPSSGRPPGAARYVAPIALYVLAGIPAVALLWDALNHLIAGIVEGRRTLLGLVGLVALVLLLVALRRTLAGWESHSSGEH